ncbi:MAG: membrane protein [marine bacterium B5-7]|nr:MAG: membrane protein [marine bacterium B5-7]
MNNNLRAGLIMVAAMLMLSLNDAAIKHTGERLDVGQILMLRGIIVMFIFAIALRASRLPLFSAALKDRWTLIRGGFEVAATVCFLSGLVLLPLGVASALVFASPIFTTIVARPLTGERVGAWRWLAVIMGFCGTVLITRPWSADWSIAMLLPIAAAVFVAGRDIVTRYIGTGQSSLHVALVTATLVTLGGVIMAPWRWQPVDPASLGWISLCGVLIAGAYFSLITAFRSGDLSFVAPLKYVALVFAIGLGALIWDERLSLVQIIGVVSVSASGLLLFAVERRRVNHD